MKKILSIALTTQPKTIAAAVAVAICSAGAYAGSYTSNGATAPVIIPGDAGQNNSLTISGATIGSVGTPSVGGGGWASLISVGGNNGVAPYEYGNITIDANNLSMYGRNTVTTGIEGIYAKTGTANSTLAVNLSNSTINIGTSGQYSNAILAENRDANGLVNIDITNSHLTNVYTGTASQSQTVYAASFGSSVLSIDSNSTVTSSGVNASGLQVGASSGTAKITSGATITTNGNNAHGILISSAQGMEVDTQGGTINTNGVAAHGIYASGGATKITNKANVIAAGDNSSAINVVSNGSGNVVVNHQAGAIARTTGTVTADNGSVQVTAIHVNKIVGGTGDVTVIADGDIYTESNNRGIGVFVENYGQGNATILATGNVTASATNASLTGANRYSHGLSAAVGNPGLSPTAQGDAIIRYSTGTVSTAGNEAYALYAYVIAKSGNVEIRNDGGTLLTTGIGSYGIWARNLAADPASATSGNATVANSGTINTSGASSHAIYTTLSTGDATVNNSGTLTTNGSGSDGIHVGNGINPGANNATITSTGDIAVNGTGAIGYGIYARVNGEITTNSSGNITVADGQGISVSTVGTGASSTVNASGNITTAKVAAGSVNGIESSALFGTSTVNYDNGTIKTVGNSVGIASYDRGSQSASNKSFINVGGNAIVDVSRGRDALEIRTNGYGEINIAAGAMIHGGTRAAIHSGATGTAAATHVINNGGTMDSMNEVLLLADTTTAPGSSLAFTNSGTMTGLVNVSTMNTSLTNSGTWNLRNFSDSDGDQSRDKLAVAVANFGSSGNNSITNSGVIALLGDNAQATTLVNTGEYATGYAANTMAIGGAVQGQILNVQTFTNSGVIDMGPGNPAVGDVLLISGGSQPGVSGGGTYIANGGRIILDTVLNEGGANSQSDMLVVDGTRLGRAADKIKVINAGGIGAITQGNGIELVRVLDKDRSADGVFKLDGRLVSGLYEYDLHQGGVDGDAGDGNWYLRSVGKGDTPRVESGVYLRNMSAASTMFMHTLHDRLGEPQYTDQYQDETNGKTTSLWVRVVGNHAEGSAANSRIDLETDTTLVHLGGDLARWSSNGKDRWHFGLMGAYGQSDTDAGLVDERVANNGMQRTANGKVEGYSVGAYATWYSNQSKPTGPYVDLWGQYAWYDNSVKGNGLKEENYDSDGWTVSVESGYAFVAGESEKRQWMIEPQAQLAYNSYSADDHYERTTNTWVKNGDTDGVIARLGARLYSRSKLGDNGIQPFVEANWWYNSAKYDLRFNGSRVNDDTPDSTFELKAGLQGQIAKGWQMWGHIGGRWGESNYSSYEGMVGVKHQF